MIILKNPALTIITPPKTASTSLHEMLCGAPHNGIYAIGPQYGGEIDKHTFCLPFISGQYETETVIVVRDPYERAVSLWSHFGHNAKWRLSFDDWIRDELTTVPFNRSISSLLNESDVTEYRYWKLEHLEECLRSAGITGTIPVTNVGVDRELTPARVEALKEWAAEDCRLFSYDPRHGLPQPVRPA